jgi:hypothetical protein
VIPVKAAFRNAIFVVALGIEAVFVVSIGPNLKEFRFVNLIEFVKLGSILLTAVGAIALSRKDDGSVQKGFSDGQFLTARRAFGCIVLHVNSFSYQIYTLFWRFLHSLRSVEMTRRYPIRSGMTGVGPAMTKRYPIRSGMTGEVL